MIKTAKQAKAIFEKHAAEFPRVSRFHTGEWAGQWLVTTRGSGFCNNIGTFETCRPALTMSACGGKTGSHGQTGKMTRMTHFGHGRLAGGMILEDLNNSRCSSPSGFYGISGHPFIASDKFYERIS